MSLRNSRGCTMPRAIFLQLIWEWHVAQRWYWIGCSWSCWSWIGSIWFRQKNPIEVRQSIWFQQFPAYSFILWWFCRRTFLWYLYLTFNWSKVTFCHRLKRQIHPNPHFGDLLGLRGQTNSEAQRKSGAHKWFLENSFVHPATSSSSLFSPPALLSTRLVYIKPVSIQLVSIELVAIQLDYQTVPCKPSISVGNISICCCSVPRMCCILLLGSLGQAGQLLPPGLSHDISADIAL